MVLMNGALTNALSVWNASRSAASTAESVASSELEYDEAEADCLVWPFQSRADLNDTVRSISSAESEPTSDTDADISNRDEQNLDASLTDKLQRVIYEQVKENLEAIGAFETYDNADVLDEWNAAGTVTTHLCNWATNGDDPVLQSYGSLVPHPAGQFDAELKSYDELVEQYPEFVPEEPENLCRIMEALPVESDTYRDYRTRLTKVLYNRDMPYADHVEFELNSLNDKSAIADDLITVFSDHVGVRYSEVKDKYSVTLPARDAAMMAVTRTGGSNRSERRGELAEWVADWYGNTDAVVEINNSRPKRMGQ